MLQPRRLLFSLASLIILVAAANVTRADTITVVGVDSGAFSTATVVCEFNAQTNTFTFTITNTSHITSPGSTSTITGIGFDLPARGNASSSGLNGFTGMQAPSLSANFGFSDGSLGTVPHGFGSPPPVVLDFAFITGDDFASGEPNDGLLPGESASFTVSGAAFAGFTEAQICNAIFVRFQSVPGAAQSGGSDVGVPEAIPEPATVLLLGTGLLGAVGAARRKLKARK